MHKLRVNFKIYFMNFRPCKLSNGNIYNRGNVDQYDWYSFVARETCLMRDEIYTYWALDHSVKTGLYLPSGQTIEYYHDYKSFHFFLRKLAGRLQKDWATHDLKYFRLKSSLIKEAEKLSQSCAKRKSRSEILRAYMRYSEAAYDFCLFIWYPWAVIHIIEPEFYKKYPDADLVSIPDKPIEFFKMQRDLSCLSAAQLCKKYGWLKIYNPFDKPYGKQDFQRFYKGLKVEEIAEQRRSSNKSHKLFQKYKVTLPARWRKKAEIIHKYAFLKTDRIDAWKKAIFYLRELCQYLSDLKPGLTLRDASFLSVREIIDLLSDRAGYIKIPDVKKRSDNQAAYIWTPNRAIVSYSKSEIKSLRNLMRQPIPVKEIKGAVASKGKASGRVTIISSSIDLKKVRPGDIFVARYTFPNFLPFMRLSAGIITDEGGLTSHAAIVSREFKIPCIIGTKVATKILKDGDLVEVDANKGVVNILKRS